MRGELTSSGRGTQTRVSPLWDACCLRLIASGASHPRSWPPPQRLDTELPPRALATVASSGVYETSSLA